MTKHKLGVLFEKLHEIVKKHQRINYGGCGVFSYYLSELLDRYNIPNYIVYLEEKQPPPFSFRCDVRFIHILVKTDFCYIDMNNYYTLNPPKTSWLNNLIYLDKRKLAEMLREPRLWNNEFNPYKREILAYDLLNIIL